MVLIWSTVNTRCRENSKASICQAFIWTTHQWVTQSGVQRRLQLTTLGTKRLAYFSFRKKQKILVMSSVAQKRCIALVTSLNPRSNLYNSNSGRQDCVRGRSCTPRNSRSLSLSCRFTHRRLFDASVSSLSGFLDLSSHQNAILLPYFSAFSQNTVCQHLEWAPL